MTSRSGKRIDPIVEAFSRLVATRPSDAVVVSSANRATFADIDGFAHQIEANLPPVDGRLIGLAAPNGAAFLAGFLALRRANAAVLLLDAKAPAEDRRYAANALGAAAILERDRLDTVEGERDIDWESIAVVKLTSGSTGAPRGVAMSAEALMADEAALAVTMGFRDGDRITASIPMSHSYGFTTVALSAIVRGLTLVMPSDEGPLSSLVAAEALGATVFPTVPSYIGALLKMAAPPAWPRSIRLVISAGAVLPAATAASFRERYGLPVHVFYGSSECGGITYDREGTAAERGSVGTPVDGVRVSLEPHEAAADNIGLVVVESDAVGQRYLPEADEQLQRGRFRTSDLAQWREGELVLLRRIDNVINVRGRKVDPAEVERVLNEMEGVDEVVVLGVASPDRREQIVRAIVACSSRTLEYGDIAAWCRARLADHKVPRSVVIVDEIPRTSRGKIDRAALLDLRGMANA